MEDATTEDIGVVAGVSQPAAETPSLAPSPVDSTPTSVWFTEVTATSGIDFRHTSGACAEKPFPAANGSGCGAIDYDRDGRCDLYFANGTTFPINPANTSAIDRCFRNLGGWRFANVTAAARLGDPGYSAGVAVGDYDDDGFSDIYVVRFDANLLYRNLGDGTFVEVALTTGVADARWGTSATFFDADEDGLLDLYVCNYAKWTWETNRFCGNRERNVRLYCSPQSVEPEDDVFYRNLGDGRFEDRTAASGLAGPAHRSQGVVAADMNDDGHIDLYVGNDIHPNTMWINDGAGNFQDQAELTGVAYDHAGGMQAGMGVDASDANRDGRTDLFVTNFENEHNAYYEQTAGGFFNDVSHSRGLAAASLPWVGWGTRFEDFDRDGWLDVLVTNGHVDDNKHLLGQDSPYAQPPLLWHNVRGNFELVGISAGGYFSQRHVGRGLAIADLDNDGDSDVVITHQDDLPALLRNDVDHNRGDGTRAIQLRLIGTRTNRDAIGSRVTVTGAASPIDVQVRGGGSYLSAHDPRVTVVLPADVADSTLVVRWPDGSTSDIRTATLGPSNLVVQPTDRQAATHLWTWEADQ